MEMIQDLSKKVDQNTAKINRKSETTGKVSYQHFLTSFKGYQSKKGNIVFLLKIRY